MNNTINKFITWSTISLITLTFVILTWLELPRFYLCIIWSITAIILLEFNIVSSFYQLRIQAYILIALASFYTVFLLTPLGEQPQKIIISSAIAAILSSYYLFGRYLQGGVETEFFEEKYVLDIFSCLGSFLLAFFLWRELPRAYVCIAWGIVAILLSEVDILSSYYGIRVQGYILAMVTNLYAGFVIFTPYQSRSIRLSSAIAAIICSYYLFGRHLKHVLKNFDEKFWIDLFSWLASFLLLFSLWRELPKKVTVSVAWAIIALIFFEICLWLNKKTFFYQSLVTIISALLYLFFGNFIQVGRINRLVTILPVIAIGYYIYGRIIKEKVSKYIQYLPDVLSWLLAIVLVSWFRFEFLIVWRPIGWSLLMTGLLILGIIFSVRSFRFQSYVLMPIIAIRLFANSWQITASTFSGGIRFTADFLTILFFVISYIICKFKKEFLSQQDSINFNNIIETHIASVIAIIISLIIALLLYLETEGNFLTAFWAVEGFILLVVGMLVKERIFRWSGLLLFIVCIVKAFLVDMRGLEPVYRIVSFIGLGLVLLVVSYLYSRYKDKLTEIL
ncbi:MAG: DUF2339 domain-containing protein [bacterium]